MSQIISLEIENVKKISAVHIKPDGPTVVIGGIKRFVEEQKRITW